MIVTLAGINLTEDWDIASLSEWWGLPGSRSDVTLRPSGDGAFTPSRTLRDVVRPSARLSIKKDAAVDAAVALSQLKSTVAVGLVPLSVDDGSGLTTRMVEVQGVEVSPGFEWWNLPVVVDMVAFDPHRYGPELCSSTGPSVPGSGAVWPAGPDGSGTAGGYVNWGSAGVPGRVQVSNVGSATAYPRLSVTGLVGSFEVTEVESGRRLRFMRPVLDGSTVVLDGRTRRAVVDGQSDVSSFLTVAEWPSVPAGATRTYFFEPVDGWSGSPTLQVCVAPAYL